MSGTGGNPTRDGHTENMLPEREVRFSPTVHHVHRRPLGLSPVPLMAMVAGVALVIALSLLVLGYWVAGILCLALSAVAIGLFVVAVRREPDSQTSQLAMTAADQADEFARLTTVSVRASIPAALELAKLWVRRQRLRFALRRRLAPLGEAVHSNDEERAGQLKAQADELDEALTETDRRSAETVAGVRDQIAQERAPSQRTERFSVVEKPAVSERDAPQ